jgi:hypothetical protein
MWEPADPLARRRRRPQVDGQRDGGHAEAEQDHGRGSDQFAREHRYQSAHTT